MAVAAAAESAESTSSLREADFSEELSWASQALSGSVAAGKRAASLSVLAGKLESLGDFRFQVLFSQLMGFGQGSSA